MSARCIVACKTVSHRRGIGRNDIAAGLQMASRPVSVHVFQRAQIELEVFHSKEYHRTTSRCSHHVCYQLKDDAPSTKRFGRVVRYYKMDAFLGTSLSSTVRFCEMDSFEVTTTPADKALGYDTVSTSSPGTKFVCLQAQGDLLRASSLQRPQRSARAAVLDQGPSVNSPALQKRASLL